MLDSAPSHQIFQQKAKREQIITQISQQVRENLDIEGVLETAARELRKNLDIEKAEIWISAEYLNTDTTVERQE